MERIGGGAPDRTGDPRLMSPLLYQLSYTAKRAGCSMPLVNHFTRPPWGPSVGLYHANRISHNH